MAFHTYFTPNTASVYSNGMEYPSWNVAYAPTIHQPQGPQEIHMAFPPIFGLVQPHSPSFSGLPPHFSNTNSAQLTEKFNISHLWVPNNFVAHVIGKKGRKVKCLEASCHCKIQLQDNIWEGSTLFVLSGETNCVLKAITDIDALIGILKPVRGKKKREWHLHEDRIERRTCLHVKQCIAVLLCRNENHLRNCVMKLTGAEITVENNSEIATDFMSNVEVDISGPENSKMQAFYLLEHFRDILYSEWARAIRNVQPHNDVSNKEPHQRHGSFKFLWSSTGNSAENRAIGAHVVLVSPSGASQLVGRRGAVISVIARDTNTVIIVQKPILILSPNMKAVFIIGSAAAIFHVKSTLSQRFGGFQDVLDLP